MQLQTSPGLVLRRTRHSEDDLRLTILLRDIGKILVLAKGGSKFTTRLKALQEPFTEADYQVSLVPHGHFARLIGGKLIRSHQNLTRNWSVFMMASRCCEVTEALLPFHAPSSEVFDILRLTLYALGAHGLPHIQWILFGMRLLQSLGYGDASRDVLKLFQPKESALFSGSMLQKESEDLYKTVSESSLNRCQAFIDARVAQILPGPLKSEALSSL